MKCLKWIFFFSILLSSIISRSQTQEEPSITLSRGGCEGMCPFYSLQVFADGHVIYKGAGFAKVQGIVKDTISIDTVRVLINEAKRIGFENLAPQYGMGGGDAPPATVSMTVNGITKQVIDFGYSNTPKALREFQMHIEFTEKPSLTFVKKSLFPRRRFLVSSQVIDLTLTFYAIPSYSSAAAWQPSERRSFIELHIARRSGSVSRLGAISTTAFITLSREGRSSGTRSC